MKKQVYCPIRRKGVEATPEEIVRQSLLHRMINELEFPIGGIAVEKQLSHMPHLLASGLKLPDRRADIVCFARGIHKEHDLYPLLLIECKAISLSSQVVNQAFGYNHYLKALYVAVANGSQIFLSRTSAKSWMSVPQFVSYSQLIAQLA